MQQRSKNSIRRIKVGWIVQGLLLSCAYLIGFSCGFHVNATNDSDCWKQDDPRLAQFMKDKVRELLKTSTTKYSVSSVEGEQYFPRELGKIVTGMARVDRDEFASNFDMGVPLDQSTKGNRNVLILYNYDDSFPSSNLFDKAQAKESHNVPLLSSTEATENCENLHVVLTDFTRKRQCIAVMGQYESFHIQKWMRLPKEKGKPVDKSLPLRLVNRGAQQNGRVSTSLPTKELTMQHWSDLTVYLNSIPGILEELKPIAKKVAKDNTIVIMVCNFGQSELLQNFACNAKAKGLDISNVLVFCTDRETQELAESLNLATYFNRFGGMPKRAAAQYADENFKKMMFAKVYCVQLVSLLGYDVLFQDVDVIWMQDPLPVFHNTTSAYYDFDIFFQDDGNHALFYAPYSANTGFYFVRHNDKTQYFFNSLLMAGDLILSTHSHQIALISLLSEHASLYGLKVKVFERNSLIFPGGFSFHRKKEFMKDVLQGRIKPFIFHMSWTENKQNKRLFFEQMGEWFTDASSCTGLNCCLEEPRVTCHYRDKPSIIPCRDSPPIHKGRPSFW